MAVPAAATLRAKIAFSRDSLPIRCRGKKMMSSIPVNYYSANYCPCGVVTLPRRFLLLTGLVPVLSNVNLALAAPNPQMEEPEIIRIRKLPGGVRVQDIVDGEGQAANEGDVVVINYVCRRSNGYFVYSTVDQFTGEAMPVTLPLDEKQSNALLTSTAVFKQIIKGLMDVLVGMKVGGKRRALIPPSMGYVNENLKPMPEEFGPRRSLLSHANEPLVFEVQLLKVL
ncbi:hypothetical protein Cgig2_008699 [Carnegiea gigantea]|uniref:peptidylprolyl isomerase n=1 Tax=Carnegiea gigantea TaxID=171969 RepID=A0A9Q1GPG4_9CARY|nr:hypothetical protein Cgig2_008699 [Carnegiea gigantea]